MNEKINLQDLSVSLAERAAITKKEAETFLRVYFETMNEELIRSESLKIKDLGTFKLSLMEDRESIDVTTGERVLIPAHYKVAFTPDKKLAETVNEPFALFETIEIEDEFESKEINFLSEEDTSEESDLALEKEDEFFDKETVVEETVDLEESEPAFEEEEEINIEKKEASENDREPEDNPDSGYEQYFENESLSEPDSEDNEVPDSEENTKSNWNGKNYCLNCHDYEAHRNYRRKYFRIRKRVKRQLVVIWILSMILIGIFSCIVYLYLHEKPLPFKNSAFISGITGLTSKKNAITENFAALSDSVVPVEKPEPEGVNEIILTPETPDKSKQLTIVAGHRLTSIALEEYGDKVFWIYIYLENKAIISNPEALSVGMKISIPPAEKYGIDCKSPVSIQKAKDLAAKKP